ncbi:methylmalonyl-CoA mutase family protein [Lutispora sp.]|nr:methylmalonyl-CoA mutase family protein [Lutispora sp.]MEA4960069.1 methylmalonyl-CoA mutase family protein [Lutispora sp.]
MNNNKEFLFSEFERTSFDAWKEEAVKLLKGKPYEKALLTKTYEGIVLNPIYTQEDFEDISHIDAYPGFAPYVRGTKADGYIAKPWDICQEIDAGHPEAFNEILLHDLYRGQTAIGIVLDKASRIGVDPDEGGDLPIGNRGLSLSTLEDVEILLDKIVLEILPIYVNTGANPLPLISLLGGYMKKNHIDYYKLNGCIGADPLGELAKEGSLPLSLGRAYDLMAQHTSWAALNAPALRTILVESSAYHEGGCDAVQELAYSIATGAEYIKEMLERDMNIDQVAPKMAFGFSLGSNFFMEIAKIRAARMLWCQIVRAYGGNKESQKMFIHAKTSSWTKTVYDPYVNMLRNASEAFSGAIAGVDSMHVASFDEAVRESDEFSRRISRNVQNILQDECHFTQPIDPAGGSWYIEALTRQVAEKAWSLFQKISGSGGIYEALKAGTLQKVIEDKYEEKFTAMSKRTHVWVGTNMYPNLSEEKLTPRSIDYSRFRKKRIQEVQDYRLSKDMFMLLDALIQLNMSDIELVDNGIEAVLAGATLGDISEITSDGVVHAEHIKPVKRQRGAERFEHLRMRSEEIRKSHEDALKVFLFNMGPIPQHKARADFSAGFFETGGFEVLKNNGFESIDEAVEAALESKASIGIICSTDDTYSELVPAIAQKVKALKPEFRLIVAGKPAKELEPEYRAAGVDDFIFLGANCYDILKGIQKEMDSND